MLDCVFPALKVYMLEVRVVGLRVPRPKGVYVRLLEVRVLDCVFPALKLV